MASGNVDETFLAFLLAAAVAMFDVISKARPGFIFTFFTIIFEALIQF